MLTTWLPSPHCRNESVKKSLHLLRAQPQMCPAIYDELLLLLLLLWLFYSMTHCSRSLLKC